MSQDRALLRWLLAHARPQAGAIMACASLLGGLGALQLAQPYVIKLAIDHGMKPGGGSLLPYVAGYLGLSALVMGLEVWQARWLQAIGQTIIKGIRHEVFARMLRQGLAFYDAHPAGQLITRATNDVEALNQMYTSVLAHVVRDTFLILGVMAAMLWLDWRMALFCFLIVPAVALASARFRRLSRSAWREVRDCLSAINASLVETLSHMRLVQAFGREAEQLAEFRVLNTAHREASLHLIRVYAVFRPLLELFGGLALAGLVVLGGMGVIDQAIGLGTLYAFTAYTRRLFEPISDLAEKYNVLQAALASGERIRELLDQPLSVPEPPPAPGTPVVIREGPTPVLEFDQVRFSYGDGRTALDELSFQVWPGETLAFVGHTGAGKSTIASLAMRFYEVDSGAVRLMGRDVREWPLSELRRQIGIVMQDVFLLAGDLESNLSLGDPTLEAEALEGALRRAGGEALLGLNGGLKAPIGERGVGLSAGQRQLVALARALAFDPPILILDEASASVDTETERGIIRALEADRAGRTRLIVAHRLSTVQGADRILVLHAGRLVEQGPHAELLARGGHYAGLWRSQSRDQAVPDAVE